MAVKQVEISAKTCRIQQEVILKPSIEPYVLENRVFES